MTIEEAQALLRAKFPGLRFYLSVTIWDDERPTVSVCVYDAVGEGKNANGTGWSLAVAVQDCLAMADDQSAEVAILMASGEA